MCIRDSASSEGLHGTEIDFPIGVAWSAGVVGQERRTGLSLSGRWKVQEDSHRAKRESDRSLLLKLHLRALRSSTQVALRRPGNSSFGSLRGLLTERPSLASSSSARVFGFLRLTHYRDASSLAPVSERDYSG